MRNSFLSRFSIINSVEMLCICRRNCLGIQESVDPYTIIYAYRLLVKQRPLQQTVSSVSYDAEEVTKIQNLIHVPLHFVLTIVTSTCEVGLSGNVVVNSQNTVYIRNLLDYGAHIRENNSCK